MQDVSLCIIVLDNHPPCCFNCITLYLFQTNCEPCTMHFDHIGHLETIQADLKEILPHLNATKFSDDFPAIKLSVKEAGQNYRYTHMYTSIPDSVLQPVFDKYRADADMFGYDFEHYSSTWFWTVLYSWWLTIKGYITWPNEYWIIFYFIIM